MDSHHTFSPDVVMRVRATIETHLGVADMANNNWDQNDDDFDNDNEDQNQGRKPSGLRAHAKTLEKTNKELADQLAATQKALRQTHISNAFKLKGINPKLADLVPETVEPTEDAVNKWVEDYGVLFGAPKDAPPAEGKSGETDSSEQGDGAGMDFVAYARTVGDMGSVNGQSVTSGSDADVLRQIREAPTHEKLVEIIESHGGLRGSG